MPLLLPFFRNQQKGEIEEEAAGLVCFGRMIGMALCRGSMSMATIVFLTCVWIPLSQLKAAISSMFDILSGRTCQMLTTASLPCEVKLLVCRFEELQRAVGSEEEICSVCLTEFTREHLVSQLHRCSHVFHLECIESWLQRNQFTCPLCRSFIFQPL